MGRIQRSKTSFGLTNLDFAKRQGNDGLVKILLEAGIREESPVPATPAAEAGRIGSRGCGEGDSAVAAVRCRVPGPGGLCVLPQQLPHGDDGV